MDLEVDAVDIEELLKEHNIELTAEEHDHLQNKQVGKLIDNIEEKEEDREDVSIAPIKEMISIWIDLQNFAERYHQAQLLQIEK